MNNNTFSRKQCKDTKNNAFIVYLLREYLYYSRYLITFNINPLELG